MVKNFLKIAGVKTKAEFYKKYPTEAAFFRAHPEARKLAQAAEGGAFLPTYGDMVLPKAMYGLGMAEGGKMPQWLAERRFGAAGKEHLMSSYGYQEGGMAPQQAPQQGGGQEEQIVQFIVQALQQGMPPEKIVEALVQQGIPQEQAVQLIQAVMQQMQQQGGGEQGTPPQQGPAEEQAEGPQGQEAPPQEMAEGQGAPMGRYGGYYKHGGMHGNPGTYADGYSGTYSNGVYFNYGGTPYLPDYSMAYGGSYQAGGQTDQLVQQVAQMLQQGVDPQMIVEQLVKAKIPKTKAVKLVQAVAQQVQQSMAQQQMGMGQTDQTGIMAYGGPYMPLSNRMNSSNFAYGGSTKYKKGGEYDMSESEIQDLINKGYKIQYL